MYDAGLTGLIMIPLAALVSLRLREPGEAGILPAENKHPAGRKQADYYVTPLAWPGWAGLLWMHL